MTETRTKSTSFDADGTVTHAEETTASGIDEGYGRSIGFGFDGENWDGAQTFATFPHWCAAGLEEASRGGAYWLDSTTYIHEVRYSDDHALISVLASVIDSDTASAIIDRDPEFFSTHVLGSTIAIPDEVTARTITPETIQGAIHSMDASGSPLAEALGEDLVVSLRKHADSLTKPHYEDERDWDYAWITLLGHAVSIASEEK